MLQMQAGVGEVFIRGPSVMAGYYKNKEDTADAFTPDGWFRSGDLGYLDRQGHLYIVGRKKDTIVLPSGKNVFPEDVENHYERSPLITEICVLGRAGCKWIRGSRAPLRGGCSGLRLSRKSSIWQSRRIVRWELEDLGRELPDISVCMTLSCALNHCHGPLLGKYADSSCIRNLTR